MSRMNSASFVSQEYPLQELCCVAFYAQHYDRLVRITFSKNLQLLLVGEIGQYLGNEERSADSKMGITSLRILWSGGMQPDDNE